MTHSGHLKANRWETHWDSLMDTRSAPLMDGLSAARMVHRSETSKDTQRETRWARRTASRSVNSKDTQMAGLRADHSAGRWADPTASNSDNQTDVRTAHRSETRLAPQWVIQLALLSVRHSEHHSELHSVCDSEFPTVLK